jgi:hypothetical protein
MGKESWLVRLTIIGSIAFMLWMGVMLDRAIAGLRAAKAQTGWRTPTHLVGPNFSEGLVTEYHEEQSIPTVGEFTVVIQGVEYRVHEPVAFDPVAINPGYYQVDTEAIKWGCLVVILWEEKNGDLRAVGGYIDSARLVGQH